jgi:geranylgeranyl diphosphate synthase type II
MSSAAAKLVKDMLEEYADLVQLRVDQKLRERREPSDLYRLAADYPLRGGRALRASLCLATAQAHGGSAVDALDTAVSLELFHNAFLVHDDIADESLLRRGRPTLHRTHGIPAALNAGDALGVMAMSPLLENCNSLGLWLGLKILREAQTMTRATVEGQGLELFWRQHDTDDIDAGDYLGMIMKKTCWYSTIYPCRVGALIGTRANVDLDRSLAYGFFLGAAFQVQDDLLNLTGEEDLYGKELNGDLLEGKRTLMLIYLMKSAAASVRERLRRFLKLPRGERSESDVRWLRAMIEDSGALEYARAIAQGLAGAAQSEYEVAFGGLPESRGRSFLKALPSWVIERA